jgi:hypothetical protein
VTSKSILGGGESRSASESSGLGPEEQHEELAAEGQAEKTEEEAEKPAKSNWWRP